MIGGEGTAIALGATAGINGALGGYRRIYDWGSPTLSGPIGFFLDSTWAAPGTLAGLGYVGLNEATGADYNAALSERKNRYVYTDSRLVPPRAAAETIGFTVAVREGADPNDALIGHETVHAWSQRVLHMGYWTIYGAWWGGGQLAGTLYGYAVGDESPATRGHLWGYFWNPGELLAYGLYNWTPWQHGVQADANRARTGH